MKTTEHRNITATRVGEDQRLDFLPTFFGLPLMRKGESLVYTWMGTLCHTYRGGLWDFYTLSNGGGYMAPRLPGPLCLRVDGNRFDGEMSADAAGIVATLFALCQLAQHSPEMVERYHQLFDFVHAHAEARAIFAAID